MGCDEYELAVQAALWGQLPPAVSGLPAQRTLAASVDSRERAELRRLMGRLAEGDRTAFAPAFILLWPQLRAFAARYVGPVDAEDAAQAALIRVFSRASEYDPERDALPWALGIAAWECRTLQRRRFRRREEAGAPAELRHPAPTPEDEAMDRDLCAAATAVLGTLRPADIETITAVASGAGRARGATFRKRLERALARFRLAWRARHGSE
jgi:RNA polymerase sigma-70 factor (ECF subfamily)